MAMHSVTGAAIAADSRPPDGPIYGLTSTRS